VTALDRIQPALAGLAVATSASLDGTTVLDVRASDVHELVHRLRHGCGFEINTFITAVDRFPSEPRFEVLWQFQSIAHGDRVRVRAWTGGKDPRAPTIVDLYPGAAFPERECYDLFGIVFDGHEGLKRLLMPEDYDHFPLRKDFPHQGIEPDRLYREWDRRRHQLAARGAPSDLTGAPDVRTPPPPAQAR
jgi:NADH-quinone oxidoreductase subunit C